MTREQKVLLKVHAEHFQVMASYVRECDPQELIDLSEACNAASDTNCGWDTYYAAQFLKVEIARHRTWLSDRVTPPATTSDDEKGVAK